MRFITGLQLAIAALAAQGTAISSRDDGDYIWDITQWQAGLSHGNPAAPVTSWYLFSVSGSSYGSSASGSSIPAFGASCSGDGAGTPLSSEYSECTVDATISEADASVAARIVPDTDSSQAHIAISYVFTDGDEIKNFTAIVVQDWARERPPHNFTISPTEVA
ncbi:hypothetical protein F4777DRAFT_581663 [Nemania sp. FL0916]|nr:hypothetical protein F4777DRAFT_581663 [Nemania sp. FL0916]